MSVHLCNTFFEHELENPTPKPVLHWLRSHPLFLQLQFLPLLYAEPHDTILVSDLPPNPDPRLRLFSESFGPLELWAPLRGENWPLIQQLNSKIFTYINAPQLSGSALLSTPQEAARWIALTPGPKVLKTPFGSAGRGHFHVGSPGLDAFLRKNLPVIGEPWVERTLDFSTQWYLHPTHTELLGETVFENNARGAYLATTVGPSLVPEWALDVHLQTAQPLVEQMRKLGYRGNVGVDAFIYRDNTVHPVVEINGRKTMSWVALHLQRKHHPEQIVRLSLENKGEGLLPQTLFVNGKTISFAKQMKKYVMNR